jgi:flagellin
MGFRVNTNVASLAAQRSLGVVSRQKTESTGKLSSGTRINKAADDAAGLAISEKLKAEIRSANQAVRNANDGISFVQVAEGGLNESQNMLTRLRELAIQASSDTIGEDERKFTNMEYQSLKGEIQRIAEVTNYNGTKLLNGSGGKLDFQIGTGNSESGDRISYYAENINSNLDSLGIADLEITTKEGAQGSLNMVDDAIKKVSGQRAELGALQNRLQSTTNNLEISVESMSASNSRIRDLDYASEAANNAKLNILETAGTAVLAQANLSSQNALKLIG